jgi:APA family basic amino acid/polyamine antiporter
VCIGIAILRFRDPDRARPFRVPFGPILVPAVGALTSLGLMFYLPPTSWLRFFLWLGVGLAIYFCYGFWRSRLRVAAAAA